MALSPEDISQLGRLARLELTDEERERYARQLSGVVEYVEQLSTVDVSEVSQRGVTGLVSVLAVDEPRSGADPASVDSQELVNGAPHHEGRFIRVRAVMSSDGGES